jgi:hypothetical protein
MMTLFVKHSAGLSTVQVHPLDKIRDALKQVPVSAEFVSFRDLKRPVGLRFRECGIDAGDTIEVIPTAVQTVSYLDHTAAVMEKLAGAHTKESCSLAPEVASPTASTSAASVHEDDIALQCHLVKHSLDDSDAGDFDAHIDEEVEFLLEHSSTTAVSSIPAVVSSNELLVQSTESVLCSPTASTSAAPEVLSSSLTVPTVSSSTLAALETDADVHGMLDSALSDEHETTPIPAMASNASADDLIDAEAACLSKQDAYHLGVSVRTGLSRKNKPLTPEDLLRKTKVLARYHARLAEKKDIRRVETLVNKRADSIDGQLKDIKTGIESLPGSLQKIVEKAVLDGMTGRIRHDDETEEERIINNRAIVRNLNSDTNKAVQKRQLDSFVDKVELMAPERKKAMTKRLENLFNKKIERELQQLEIKEQKKAEDERKKAEKKAEDERKKAEDERKKAEKKAEDERKKAEKKAEADRKKAEKKAEAERIKAERAEAKAKAASRKRKSVDDHMMEYVDASAYILSQPSTVVITELDEEDDDPSTAAIAEIQDEEQAEDAY